MAQVFLKRSIDFYLQGVAVDHTDYYLLLNAVTTQRICAALVDTPARGADAAGLLPVAR